MASATAMEDDEPFDMREVLSLLRRQRSLIAVTALVIMTAALAVAIVVPATYRSSATILVQEQEIPPELVRSTVTSYADERIQVISQQVMTRAVLMNLIETYGLYERYRGRDSMENLVERMRKDIRVTTVNADVSDRSSGRRVNATIAFRVSYDAPRPEQAQKVVDQLVSLFLSENAKARQRSVAETAAFLGEEADRLARQIQAIETKLAAFERRYSGRLPDSADVNMQLAERTDSELQRVERELSMLQDRKVYFENQLALVSADMPAAPGTPAERALGPEDRLRALQSELAQASTKYSAEHPDVRRLKREIAAAQAEASRAASADGRAQGGQSAQGPAPAARGPTNPAYISLVTQLETTKREITHLQSSRDDLRARRRSYDARLLEIPDIKREYRDLTRDYENAQVRYREVKAKQMQAEVAKELEREQRGERFSLGEPADLPQRPVSPNRPQIILIGLVASLGAGFGLGWLRDRLDPSIKGPWQLQRLAGGPLLMTIPYIETRGERLAESARMRAFLVAVVLVCVALVVLVHFFLRPLPEIWDAVLRRVAVW